MRLFNVMALLCLISLTGCNPEFTEQDVIEESPMLETVSSKNLDKFLTVKAQPTAQPEKYMVYFSWPKIEDNKLVRIRLDKTLAVVNPNQTDFNHEVFHDQVLTYNFEILDNASKIEKVFPKQIKIPRDFVVREGQSEFTEDTRINVNRIFILNDKPLQTNGFNVELVANELRSEKGVIETFPENSKAPTNTNGKTGGKLTIKIQSATGDLNIYMRGQNGGDGTQGESYPNRAVDGATAGTGSRVCECIGKECFIVASNLITERVVCSCESKGENGGNGVNGVKGRKGHAAGNGGGAGELNISIQDGREFDLQTYSYKGLAGTPGDGGDGQDGGVGGQKPNNDIQTRECGGNAGANGSKGPKGDRGELGSDGNLGLMCVYIASENKNDCYQ